MKNQIVHLFIVLALGTIMYRADAQGTAFIYQGRLNNNDSPANGSYDLSFSLYTVNSGGSAFAGPVTPAATSVSNGLFTVTLDFGSSVFTGPTYWLDISVRTNGGGAYTELSPRQQIAPTPYTIYSEKAGTANAVISNSVSASQLNTAGAPASGQVLSFDGTNLAWSNAGASGTGNAWLLTGNSNLTPGLNFIGTTDTNALELDAESTRALRLEPDSRGFSAGNLIGGYISNVIMQPGSGGDTIAGGGIANYPNVIFTNSSGVFIGAGSGNQVGPDANDCVIAGGFGNVIQAPESFIGAGYGNAIQVNALHSLIGGGNLNTIQPDAEGAIIVGGTGNTVLAGVSGALIVGGFENTNAGVNSTIGGGVFNFTSGPGSVIGGGGYDGTDLGGNIASGAASTVSGGFLNAADGNFATVPGGYANIAGGTYSFAAGQQAQALHQGSFVWADSQSAPFASTGNDQFCIRAQGGLQLTGSDTATLMTVTGFGLTVGDGFNTLMAVTSSGLTVGGGFNPLMEVNSSGLTVRGTFVSSSDRNLKENFQSIHPREVLEKVAALPVTKWNYKADAGTRHIGPMAQDFHAAFNIGPDERHIAVIDEDGVALAAIQGLNQKLEERDQKLEAYVKIKDAEIQQLKQNVAELKELISHVIKQDPNSH